MRHGHGYRKLGRVSAHRKAMFKNQANSLLSHERIMTTLHKAKELRSVVEKIITLGKRGDVHSRRLVFSKLQNKEVITKLFTTLAPRYSTRPGGYTRILRLQRREGDGAQMALIEMVDRPTENAAK